MPLFGKKTDKKATKLFFATDVHGSERTWRKFLNAGKFYGAEVLVMGGDIIGKMAIPIIREGPGRYRATLQGSVQHLEGDEALKALQDRIAFLGFYSQVMAEEEYRALAADPAAVDALFHELARQRLASWIALAEERLAGTGIRAFVTGGNDDYADVLAVLKQSSNGNLIDCEGKAVPIDDDHTMISIGLSTPTPWKTPREVSEEELWAEIEKMAAQVPDLHKAVFNFHDPPNDSTLDTCPMLDWSKDPPVQIVKAGQVVLHGAGSKSVRRAVETYQPILGLHGHIHESAGVAKIGRTVCINPGSEYGEGVLRGVLVQLRAGEIDGYQLTSG
jgi:Icc-related predicted phosphoesterase